MSVTLENLGSLITYKDNGTDHCLGSLFVHAGNAYDPELGKVDVTEEQANTHNKLLDEALIKGLDERCQVGQGGTFYLHANASSPHGWQVRTWTGVVVSDDVRVTNFVRKHRNVVFSRNGKKYKGRQRQDEDCFNFVRIN